MFETATVSTNSACTTKKSLNVQLMLTINQQVALTERGNQLFVLLIRVRLEMRGSLGLEVEYCDATVESGGNLNRRDQAVIKALKGLNST